MRTTEQALENIMKGELSSRRQCDTIDGIGEVSDPALAEKLVTRLVSLISTNPHSAVQESALDALGNFERAMVCSRLSDIVGSLTGDNQEYVRVFLEDAKSSCR